MRKSNFIYRVLVVLMAVLILAGWASTRANAEDFGSAVPAATDSTPPSSPQQITGFELETPAEAGAQPIPSPYVMPLPEAVPPFPIQLNQAVRRYVSDFMSSPDHLQDTFDRSHPYLPDMVKVLRSYGLPDDLVYLAFAESEFSKRGKGPWQFNSETAKRFGLKIDNYVDERRDPVMSTKAAAEYLATLHDEAGDDWPMTLVAWNNGDRAINRYWSLRGRDMERFGSRLPRRTRGLMGRFMAVAYIAHHADSYGITPIKLDDPPAFQMLDVRGGTPLSRVALDHGTTLERLRELNPALLRDVVPPNERSYSVRVPVESSDTHPSL
ncbi:MAG: lytic transglycosylase domain-containing protein [Candidatus Binatus sp.]|jgi:membrane-bound lytic murein transglycosylase D|uniref:lytic transglycosylase domain-containing protein n=1 Tax=Candidatus Binatus sp. TaxID=2811406 RepID=UPI003C708697